MQRRWIAGVSLIAVFALVGTACTTATRRVAPAPVAVQSVAVQSVAALSSSMEAVASARPAISTATTPVVTTTPTTPTAPTAVAPPAQSAAISTGSDASHPCGWAAAAHYTHVVWLWMENKEYGSVIGNPAAPFENALAAECGLATSYRGITHPSLPNYLAATAGSTFGIRDDGSPSAHPLAADSIFGQLERAGLSWRSYEESMGVPCQRDQAGEYAVKHNPAAYFTALAGTCATDDVPLQGGLATAITVGDLPSFTFITPNLCDDTHDCAVEVGDGWLDTWMSRILNGPNYRAGNTLLVVTWDEGVGIANQIPTIVVGPTVPPGTRATQMFTHYSLLATTEDLLRLPRLGAAVTASGMLSAFDL